MSAKPQLAPLSLPEDQIHRWVWRLQVRSARGAEEALFASRSGALKLGMVGIRLQLSEPVTAFHLSVDRLGTTRSGFLSELLAESVVELCGDGFNAQTVKVRVDDQYYFVFTRDLESAEVVTVVTS